MIIIISRGVKLLIYSMQTNNNFSLDFHYIICLTFQQYNHTSWSHNPQPVVPLGRGDIGKPNSNDDDSNVSSRWRAFLSNNEGNHEIYLLSIFPLQAAKNYAAPLLEEFNWIIFSFNVKVVR